MERDSVLIWPSRAREREEMKYLEPEVSRDSHQASSFSVLEDQAELFQVRDRLTLTLHIISATSASCLSATV